MHQIFGGVAILLLLVGIFAYYNLNKDKTGGAAPEGAMASKAQYSAQAVQSLLSSAATMGMEVSTMGFYGSNPGNCYDGAVYCGGSCMKCVNQDPYPTTPPAQITNLYFPKCSGTTTSCTTCLDTSAYKPSWGDDGAFHCCPPANPYYYWDDSYGKGMCHTNAPQSCVDIIDNWYCSGSVLTDSCDEEILDCSTVKGKVKYNRCEEDVDLEGAGHFGALCVECLQDSECGMGYMCDMESGNCEPKTAQCGDGNCDSTENCGSCLADCPCATGKNCIGGSCVNDPCTGVTCNPTCNGNTRSYCADGSNCCLNGACQYTTQVCTDGCENGVCKQPGQCPGGCPDKCIGQERKYQGTCVNSQCQYQSETCPNGCENGACKGVCNNNGVCDAGETNANCPNDCKQTCDNDGTCDAGENTANCPNDCKSPVCGNGVCETGETTTSCPGDCKEEGFCDKNGGVCMGSIIVAVLAIFGGIFWYVIKKM